jgi:hypothetical protein
MNCVSLHKKITSASNDEVMKGQEPNNMGLFWRWWWQSRMDEENGRKMNGLRGIG